MPLLKQFIITSCLLSLIACNNNKPVENQNITNSAIPNRKGDSAKPSIKHNEDKKDNNTDDSYPNDSIIGIGEVENRNLGSTYNIYDSTGKLFLSIKHLESDSLNDVIVKYMGKKYSVYKKQEKTDFFSPRDFGTNVDYFSLILDCIKKTDKYYEVVINNKEHTVGYIKIGDSNFKFFTIDKFIEGWTGLGFSFDRNTNPLRKEPADSSTIIRIDNKETIENVGDDSKLQMKGDWLKIRTLQNKKGWIRWRKGKRILIKLDYAC